jgi:uncharacterized protein (TIGR02147 family)
MVNAEMEKSVPEVFHYTDFRAFLADAAAALKAWDSRISHRFINRKVGATSAGWFADVVKGRISLTGRFMVGLVRFLNLKPRQSQYFEALVNYAQAGSPEERARHLETMMSLQELRMDTVGRDQFEFYGHWCHAAIRELLCFHDFDGSFEELGRRLRPPLNARQARKSLELLAKLDLIHKDAQGRWRPSATLLKKDPAFKSLNLHRYLGAFADMAKDALIRFPKEERDISCLTLSLSEEGFAEAKAELADLRKRLLERAAKEKRPTKVFQCNLQFFPLSQ